jgi:hypothetical protein
MTINSTTAFDALAITSSVPFRLSMTGSELRTILETGVVPPHFRPHLHRALTEAPVEMIERVAAKFEPADAFMRRLRAIAIEVDAVERIDTWLRG